MNKWLRSLLMMLLLPGAAVFAETGVAARSQGTVMWALAGVKPRDRAHWVRNFDFHQRVPGIAAMPMVVKDEADGHTFLPEELRQLAVLSDAAECRFFFVVEVGPLRETVNAFPEGRRRNFQQHFRQEVGLTAYRKAPESGQWEKVDPVRGGAEHKDMVGMSDLPRDELDRRKNQQRCEFLRKYPAETAAELVGRVLVEVEGRFEAGGRNGDIHFMYTLTNRSPLPLSTIYVTLPIQTPEGRRAHEFLFGASLQQVGTLEPYGRAAAEEVVPFEPSWRPGPGNAWVSIDGWLQEELDSRRALRERRRVARRDWQEHAELPPAAHEMDWETEEGQVRIGE